MNNAEQFFRSTCGKCGIFIDSAYCKEVENQGYKCGGCGTICSYDKNEIGAGQAYFVRMSNIDEKRKDVAKRITLRSGIENFVKTAGLYGWIVTEYTPITKNGHEPVIKVNTTTKFKPQLQTAGG